MRFISRVFLPLLLLAYIATETYLKLQHKSLCGEVGCKLAGELLNFDALYLNYAGLAGVFVLTILGFLSLKNKFYEALFFVGLYSAIAFEATIISYQFIANPEPCIFCLGVISSLLLIALVSHIKHFAITVATVLSIFVGLNTLAITQNKAFTTTEGNYLIYSSTCPHCKKVKAYLAKHKIDYTPISVKESNARMFLKFANITSIPVLIVKNKRDLTVTVGDKKIISHFEKPVKKDIDNIKKEEKHTVQTQQSSTMPLGGINADFLNAGGADAGCAITITDTPSCADDNASNSR